MRNPNGYGTIKKLSGKRRKPFAVYVTTRFEMISSIPSVEHLQKYLSEETYNTVQSELEAYAKEHPPTKHRQKQMCIGYFETKRQAMIALADYNKNPLDVNKMEITFAEVYDKVKENMAGKVKMKDSASYKTAYKKCESLYGMRMRDIKLAHMQAIIDSHSDLSSSSLTNIATIFKSVFKYSMENDIVEKDYSIFVRVKTEAGTKTRVPYTKEEVALIWDNVDWLAPNKRQNLITGIPMADTVLIMIYTGVRIGELLSIKKEDVHLEERWIKIQGTKTEAAERIVPIHKKIIPLIENRLSISTGEYLICGNSGEEIKYPQYKKMFFFKFNETFNMDHTPHECRHTFATVSAASRMNPILRKKIIGHVANDITDDVYTHVFIEDIVKEIDKFDL